MNKLTTFQIAKLIKEKGFKEECRNAYVDLRPLEKTFSEEVTEYLYEQNHNTFDYRYSAPTTAETIMWLYDKHNIWIECLHSNDMGGFTFKVSHIKKGWRTKPHYICNEYFESPTEAYLEGIIYALKELI